MREFISGLLTASVLLMAGCQPETANVNGGRSNTNVTVSNSVDGNSSVNANANTASVDSSSTITETREPARYQAIVQLKLEATGQQQSAAMPPLTANVGRDGTDRRMEFNLPGGEQFVYLDKGGTNYLVLPKRKQYAILDKESLGFEVRRMMMPEQIIDQVKAVRGVERIGEENVNGRKVVKYRYGAVTNTQTQAGQINTESIFLIDMETGLPIHSETVSQAQSGNVQGLKGLRIVTEMSDIKTDPAPELFAAPPADYQKIDAAQVKEQADLIFNAVAVLLGQVLKTAQSGGNSNANTPVR